MMSGQQLLASNLSDGAGGPGRLIIGSEYGDGVRSNLVIS